MPRLILRSSRGLANMLDVLSVVKHFGAAGEISGSSIQAFYAPRDAVTNHHLGFVFIETDKSSADAILSAGTQYVKTPLPSLRSRHSTGDLTMRQQAVRNRVSLQDIMNLKTTSTASASESMPDDPDHPDNQRILEITAEASLEKPMRRSDQQIRGHLAAKRGQSEYLADALMLFNGFASPGKIRSTLNTARNSAQSSSNDTSPA